MCGVVISALAASREKWHLKRALVVLYVCPCSCNEVACALWYNGWCDCYSNFVSEISNIYLHSKSEVPFSVSYLFLWIILSGHMQTEGKRRFIFFSGKRKLSSTHFLSVSVSERTVAQNPKCVKKKFSTLKAITWECREWYNCLTPFPPGWVRPSIKEQNLLTSFRHCRQVFHDFDDRDDGDDGENDDEW